MTEQPSLLDYLKSLVDPRRKPIRINELFENAPEAVEPETSPELRVEGAVLRTPYASLEVEAPVVQEAAAAGRMPWRTMAAFLLAVFGQATFEPADRQPETGLLFYGAAIVLALWAFRAGELTLSASPAVAAKDEDFRYRKRLVWPAAVVLGLAFLFLGGTRFRAENLFTPFNVTFWLGGLLLFALGFWTYRQQSPGLWARLTARLRPPFEFRITGWHLAMAAAVIMVLFFRFYRLSEVPAEMFSDHAEKLQDVQDVLNGMTHIFFPRNTGREFVQMYLTAFTARTLGFDLTFMALKMGTALAGLVTLPYIYLLGKEIASREAGLIAAVLAGISYWLNVITRVALRFSLYPLFVAPTLYYVVRGLRRGNRNDFILAGIFLGLGLHGYSPFRFVPILVVLVIGLYVLHHLNRVDVNRAAWHLALVVLVSLIVFMPLLRYMTSSDENMANVMYRSLTRISTVETEFPDNPVVIFGQNMGRVMAMFAWDNGNTWVHSVPSRPALDVVTAPLFYLGYALMIYRYATRRRWEDGMLLLSVPMLLLPSAMSLAFPAENPSLNRTGGAIIPVFLIVAITLEGILRAIKGWFAGERGRMAAWAAAGIILAIAASENYNLVFKEYDRQFRLSAWNTSELGAVIRGFADSIGSEETAWVIPWPHWVDTRLVGINAGVYIRDYAVPRDLLDQTAGFPGAKLYLVHVDDIDTLNELYRLYPDGVETRYVSETPGKDFLVFLAASR